jgi:hypothetical protein
MMSPLRAIANREIADVLERVAVLLETQDANRHRVAAYRRAALAIRAHPVPVVDVFAKGGLQALDALPAIGPTIASHVAELAQRGGSTLLERLEGEVSPERLFATVAGIGPELAARIHRELCVETLEDLERAAHDGRLAGIPGFGPRRVRAVRDQLAAILGRSARHRIRRGAAAGPGAPRPEVGTLLAIDAEYRDGAAQGRLRRIAPRRFNPEGKAWLPILHAQRDGWQITALFSNTARAHELGRTGDWVVLFYERDGDSGQCTVVTETRGPLAGRRVVRGRESESERRPGLENAAEPAAPADWPSPRHGWGWVPQR